MEIITSKQVSSGSTNQSLVTSTPPQTILSSVEKELDTVFIRALNLLHSTDPEAKHELRRLVDQQIEQATAVQTSNKPKSSFSIADIKKTVTPIRLKEKSPHVVTTTTTLVSGGVNRLSSSSDDEEPIPPPTRRVTASDQISHKRIKLAHRDLLGESDDSVDNSTDNDSFEDLLKETDKPDPPLHHTPTQKPNIPEISRPNRVPTKITTAFIQQPVDKQGHSRGVQRLLPTMTHKKLLSGGAHSNSRLKNKTGMKVKLKKQLCKRK